MIDAILWDNDGVLVDTEHLFYAVNRELFAELGVEVGEKEFLDWFLIDNCGAWHMLEGRGASGAQVSAWRDERNRRYGARLLAGRDLAIGGMDAVLARCAARVPMAVVTSSNREHFDIIHGKLDLLRHFQFVIADGDYANSKPAPDPYLLGIERLGVAAHRCLAVEDSPRGLQAARAAGMECIVVRSALTRGHKFDGAYRVVDSVAQLDEELARLLV